MRIRWQDLDSEGYEDMVSVLLSRLYPNSQRIDGKGGDGGRDVQIVEPGGGRIIHAFELKSFTGRITPSRKQQVKNSLKQAANLQPPRWTLVVPIDPTPKELEWFDSLRSDHEFELDWKGKTWLDEKMSLFPDIHRYFIENASQEVLNLLIQIREEDAMISTATTALKRLQGLRERLNEIDPYFRYELSTGNLPWNSRPASVVMSVTVENMRVDIHEKYLDALKDRPITASVDLNISPSDKALSEGIQRAVDYGDPVTIPSSALASFTVDAPAGLGGSFSGMELEISASTEELKDPMPIRLNVMEGDRVLAAWPAEITQRQVGQNGVIAKGWDHTGWLHIEITMNRVQQTMSGRLRLRPKPAIPSTILPLLRWLRALQSSLQFTIILPGDAEIRCSGPPLPDPSRGVQVVEALVYLQQRANVYFSMAFEIPVEVQAAILDFATLLQQEHSSFSWDSLTLTFARWDPSLDVLVNEAPLEVTWVQEETLRLDGGAIPIGQVRYVLESARALDPDLIKSGRNSGSEVEVEIVPAHSDKGQKSIVTSG